MIKGTTKSGFEFEVDEHIADNMELLDALVEAEENDPVAISTVAKIMLDNDSKKRLYNHVRTEDGRVPIMNTFTELVEIIAATGKQGKN